MARLIVDLRAILGERGLLTDPADIAPYGEDWRRLYRGRAAGGGAAGRHGSRWRRWCGPCVAAGVGVVPQGGNTSMVGGAVPAEDGSELVLSALHG